MSNYSHFRFRVAHFLGRCTESRNEEQATQFLSFKHTHLFEMMGHVYFSRCKLFDYKYVHIVEPNVLHFDKKNNFLQ